MNIDPKRLKEIRNARKHTIASLAKASGLSERNIKNYESPSGSKKKQPNQRTIDNLCKALKIEPGHLSGELDLPGELHNKIEEKGTRRSISLRFGRKQELELIKRVYGVTPEQVINMAPFLFVLMAEGSLKWRTSMLKDITKALHSCSNANHLSFAHNADHHGADFGYFLEFEEASIQAKDIFGETLHDNEIIYGVNTGFDTERGNPFSDYLSKLADEIFDDSKSDNALEIDRDFGSDELPFYEMLESEMDKICAGNRLCREAIRWGDISIKDIPDGLQKDHLAFASWVENRASDKTKDLAKSLDSLGQDLKI